jgi:hypothetical protein
MHDPAGGRSRTRRRSWRTGRERHPRPGNGGCRAPYDERVRYSYGTVMEKSATIKVQQSHYISTSRPWAATEFRIHQFQYNRALHGIQ